MIEAIVRLLRPLVVPLLKLSFEPPHLPEGSHLVRHLRPSEAWLSYRYLQTLFGAFGQVVGTTAGAIALMLQLDEWGVVLAIALLVLQGASLAVAFVSARVDYELRHYLVGDRSVRVTSGVMIRNEATLSYANVQNVEVNQGPLERLFGFKSLTITTAGADAPGESVGTLHSVTLVGLPDAERVREQIMGMLRQHKDPGLGEPHAAPSLRGLPLAQLEAVKAAAARLERAAVQASAPA